jgi:ribonuclease E
MTVNVLISLASSRGECRVAVVEDGLAQVQPPSPLRAPNLIGNIYWGRVVHIEPSIQSAFLDIGLERNGFLHVSDIEPSFYPANPKARHNPKAGPVRQGRPPIETFLKRGDPLTVQLLSWTDPKKDPTLTTYVSLAGPSLVLMPTLHQERGISKRISDEERERLRPLLAQLRAPGGIGFILRESGASRSPAEWQAELTWLGRYWRLVSRRASVCMTPGRIYRAHDPVCDAVSFALLRTDVEAVWLDNARAHRRACGFARLTLPHGVERVRLHEGPGGLFERFGVTGS